jgi:hypothetical protein
MTGQSKLQFFSRHVWSVRHQADSLCILIYSLSAQGCNMNDDNASNVF